MPKVWYDIQVWHVQLIGQKKKFDKLTFQIMPILNKCQYQHYPKIKDGPKWIVEFADLYNLNTRQKLKM